MQLCYDCLNESNITETIFQTLENNFTFLFIYSICFFPLNLEYTLNRKFLKIS